MFIAVLFTITTETIQMPIGRWMHKERVAYLYNETLYKWSLKKEGNSAICSNMYGLRGQYVKWSMPVTEEEMPHDSTYRKCLQ